MTDYFDINLWGIFAMPVGVALCFGPVLLACLAKSPDSTIRDNSKTDTHPLASKPKHDR